MAILPQDGSGVAGDCAAVVYSTAVEAQVPDFAEARRLGVPLVHRSELLAHFVAERRTLAITGTSGKSTTVAMVFEILRGAGPGPVGDHRRRAGGAAAGGAVGQRLGRRARTCWWWRRTKATDRWCATGPPWG